MTRVLHVVRQYAPSMGGLEKVVAALVADQRRAGLDCEILTLDRLFHGGDGQRLPAEDTIDGVRVHRVGCRGVPRYFVPVARRAILDSYDVIHMHGMDGLFEWVAQRPRRPGQALVATTHGAIFHTNFLMPLKRVYFEHRLLPLAQRYDAITAISRSDFELIKGRHPNAQLIWNGVRSLGPFKAQGRDLIYIGRLSQNKQVDLLIRAFAEPAVQATGARLNIVGPEWDVTRKGLEELAATLGVADRVRVHGMLDDGELAAVAQQCAVFVSASRFEGLGQSIIEGMGVGLIPAAQANASFSDIVADSGVGAVTDYAVPAAAAETIVAQLAAARSEALRQKAIEFAAGFSEEAYAAKMAELYQACLAAVRGGRTPSPAVTAGV